MPHDDSITIGQICDAMRRIQRFAAGLDRDAFMTDELRQSAIERQLFIVCEAVVSRLSSEFKATYPDIEWSNIKRMRNILAHAYDFVNLDIVWQTVTEDIPKLLTAFEPLEPHFDSNVNPSPCQ